MNDNQLCTLRDTITFRALGDELRMNILRRLMTKAATLSQLGQALDMHPAKVRYHLKQLESAGLVELDHTRVLRGFVEKYYRASARTYFISVAILPELTNHQCVLALGSHDMALELLSEKSHEDQSTPDLFTLPLGSLNGLIALRQGMGQMAGSHLLDPPSGEYNLTYVRHIFPDQEVKIVTLAHRQQGLMVQSGNPLSILDLMDISRAEVRFVNRKPGSGTRVWLDVQIQQLGIEHDQINGYDCEMDTHLQVADLIAQGKADTGLGLMAAARKLQLDFIPLFEERYDLVIPIEYYQSSLLAPTLDQIHTASFRSAVEALGGYNAKSTGNEVPV